MGPQPPGHSTICQFGNGSSPFHDDQGESRLLESRLPSFITLPQLDLFICWIVGWLVCGARYQTKGLEHAKHVVSTTGLLSPTLENSDNVR